MGIDREPEMAQTKTEVKQQKLLVQTELEKGQTHRRRKSAPQPRQERARPVHTCTAERGHAGGVD